MLAVAKRTILTYFLMRSDNTVMPKQFIGNKVTGIFFENKADYATWFGANPEFIHGIQ
jgi:endo-1,3(4)-beta-glucanase